MKEGLVLLPQDAGGRRRRRAIATLLDLVLDRGERFRELGRLGAELAVEQGEGRVRGALDLRARGRRGRQGRGVQSGLDVAAHQTQGSRETRLILDLERPRLFIIRLKTGKRT